MSDVKRGGVYLMRRGWMKNPVFKAEPFTEREAWIWLIDAASYQPHKIRYHNQMISVDRGQVPISYRKLQEEWKWGVHRVRNFLSLIESEGMITRQIETGFLIITLCNYEEIQDSLRNTATQTATQSATDAATPPTTDTATNTTKGTNQDTPLSSASTFEWDFEFNAFIAQYPKHNGAIKKARQAYIDQRKKGINHDTLCDGARRYAAYVNTTNTRPQYVEYPHNWLSSEGWLNEYHHKAAAKPSGSIRSGKTDSAKAAIMRAAEAGNFAH